MKTAIILQQNPQLAGELNRFLAQNPLPLKQVELWLLCQSNEVTDIADLGLPIEKIILITVEQNPVAENYLRQLQQLYHTAPYQLLLFAGDQLSQQLATRLAFRLHGSSQINIDQACYNRQQQNLTVTKSVYANNLQAQLSLTQPPYCLSISRTSAPPAEKLALNHPQQIFAANSYQPDWLIDYPLSQHGENNLQPGECVLVVGRGINPQQLALVEKLAQQMKATVLATRPVVMNGWLPLDRMVGVSGLKLSARLCLVVGASGAAAFAIGIKACQFIIAINSDPEAAIFKLADVAIVDDSQVILQTLSDCLADIPANE